jgi:hypothetical protein
VSVFGTVERYRQAPVSRLEIQPLSELRDAAARLLAETYARRLAAEPLLPDAADFGAYAAPEPQAVDRRMVNLLSSRFWPRRGFRARYLRLYRAVP